MPPNHAFTALYRKLSRSASGDTGDMPANLSLAKRCLCVLLSYVMLLSPVVLEVLAQGTNDYATLDTATGGAADTTITYSYDANGSLTSKVTKATDTNIISKYLFRM